MASATWIAATHVDIAGLITFVAPSAPLDSARPFSANVLTIGPWDEVNDPWPVNGVSSLPMPVQVSEPDALAPFFQHLRNGGTHLPAEDGTAGLEPSYDEELVEFNKGVLYADGRLDLCKMVTGPRNIGALMDSLWTNTFARHFLLGNNIIGPVGARAIADFISEHPGRFETWYLAGNCIDTASFALLVNAMITSPTITNVWIKRNPLSPAAAHDVFRLITQCASLRTLDLDQTSLGDSGVAALFTLLATHDQPLPLRHIYLNGTGASYAACTAIARYLASHHCALTSLYLSHNPIGDAAPLLAPGLAASSSLARLTLQSCGLKDASCATLLRALTAHSSSPLRTLELGYAYATADLGSRHNWLGAECAAALAALLASPGCELQYLGVGHAPTLPTTELNALLATAAESASLLWCRVVPLVKTRATATMSTREELRLGRETRRLRGALGQRLRANVKESYGMDIAWEEWDRAFRRFLVSPRDVRFIDSVYRNRDSMLSRRGQKRLDKWWVEGDETLANAQRGLVVETVLVSRE